MRVTGTVCLVTLQDCCKRGVNEKAKALKLEKKMEGNKAGAVVTLTGLLLLVSCLTSQQHVSQGQNRHGQTHWLGEG